MKRTMLLVPRTRRTTLLLLSAVGARTATIVASLLLPSAPFAVKAAWAQDKPAISLADYGQWEQLEGPARLSPDGQWLGYVIGRVNEDDELRVRSVERGTTIVVPFGSDAVFDPNSRWLAYSIGVPPDERERLEEEGEPVRSRLGILDLRTADTTSTPAVASFRFSADGRFLAMYGYPTEGDSTGAADLLVRELASGSTTHFGNVAEFRWSDGGALLALSIRSASGAGNGVHLYNARSSTLRVLDSSPSVYRGLAWRRCGRPGRAPHGGRLHVPRHHTRRSRLARPRARQSATTRARPLTRARVAAGHPHRRTSHA